MAKQDPFKAMTLAILLCSDVFAKMPLELLYIEHNVYHIFDGGITIGRVRESEWASKQKDLVRIFYRTKAD